MTRLHHTPDSSQNHLDADDSNAVAAPAQTLVQQFNNALQDNQPDGEQAEALNPHIDFMNKELTPVGSDAISSTPRSRRQPEFAAPDTAVPQQQDNWRYVRGMQANN